MELFIDSSLTDQQRRDRTFAGDAFIYRSSAAADALCKFAQQFLEEAFHPLDPRLAQHSMSVEDYSALLAELKPKFIHHDTAKTLIRELLEERGCALDRTFFDVPRLRSSTSNGYLTSGIAYAFHPHRDTWYSAPRCQINWWLPVYSAPPGAGMVFHPLYWARRVRNGSEKYDYQRWVRDSRFAAGKQIGRDIREQPRPEESMELGGGVIANGEPGSVIVFSAAQMHASAENCSGETRFSIDFRTFHLDDLTQERGAPNIDSRCTGTTVGDFLRGSDLAPVPEEWVAHYMRVGAGPLE